MGAEVQPKSHRGGTSIALVLSPQVDFEELAESLLQLEQRCKASWEHLKAIAKHECKPALKSKLLDFLQASTEKMGLLKIVHRRVMNRSVSLDGLTAAIP